MPRHPFTPIVLLTLASSALLSALPHPPQPHQAQQQQQQPLTIPSRHHSTLLARRLLALTPTAILSTTFPSAQNLTHDPAYRYTPDNVADMPIGMPEYIAGDCDPERDGDVVMIMLGLSTVAKNARGGRSVAVEVDWWEGYQHAAEGQRRRGGGGGGGGGGGAATDGVWGRAALPRVSLLGRLEEMSDEEVEQGDVVSCFEKVHPDAKGWRPGRREGAHVGGWVRLRVEAVYWVGGFGDRAYIGWLDLEEWKGVGREEWEDVRLPGEEEGKEGGREMELEEL